MLLQILLKGTAPQTITGLNLPYGVYKATLQEIGYNGSHGVINISCDKLMPNFGNIQGITFLGGESLVVGVGPTRCNREYTLTIDGQGLTFNVVDVATGAAPATMPACVLIFDVGALPL